MSSAPENVTTIGTSYSRYHPGLFGIRQPDRLLHMYIVGQTGTGKSTLLFNLMKQDVEHGQGYCLIDPHGDLAEEVAAIAGPNQIYWNVADPDCQYGYNPLTYVSAEYPIKEELDASEAGYALCIAVRDFLLEADIGEFQMTYYENKSPCIIREDHDEK